MFTGDFSTAPRSVTADVFTADELARAALVDPARVRAMVAAGAIPVVAGTRFIAVEDAIAAGRTLRADVVAAVALTPDELFERTAHPRAAVDRRDGVRAF